MKNTDLNEKRKNKAEKKEIQNEKIEEQLMEKQQDINALLNKKSNFKVYELIIFAVLITAATAFLTFLILYKANIINNNKINLSNSFKKNKFAELEEVYELIQSSYYKKVSDKDLIDGAINGMLSSLKDPHTSYLNAVETENFNEVMNGSYEGIGAEISINDKNEVFIFSVFKNSPAYEVGLKFGDVILKVNDKSTEGLTTSEVVTLIKDVNIPVAKMTIKRGDSILEFNVKKRIVVIESVESEIIKENNKKIGYIIVNNFANNTYEQFKEKVEELEEKNIEGLIIDVRGNTGGYLHIVTNMLNMFLPKGKIIYQIQDRNTTTKYEATTNESRNYPIAVLVNKASASASEILAIGLKESYDAYVVGTNTYGKGTVQTTLNLSSGAMIKYTIQKWLSPKGNWINEKGVTPTHEVELSKEFENNPSLENDNQLKKAMELIANKN